jgi:hypothetical protein
VRRGGRQPTLLHYALRLWLRHLPPPHAIYQPGSALLADLALRAHAAGVVHRRRSQKWTEGYLWQQLQGLAEEGNQSE